MKTCIQCSSPLVRAPSRSDREWAAQRFCGATCSAAHFGAAGGTASHVDPSFDVLATRELLKRLLRYGLRHDGLPGLAAPTLLQLASDMQVAA